MKKYAAESINSAQVLARWTNSKVFNLMSSSLSSFTCFPSK